MPENVLLRTAGSLHDAYRAVDWTTSPLGPVEGWSPSLRDAAHLALQSGFAITLLWGPQYALVYNAAYAEIIGDKHPAALGRPAEEMFPEAWDAIAPLLERAAAGEAILLHDEYMPLDRRGFLEECHFTFGYSPVSGLDGTVEGVIDIVTETTGQVIDRRRLRLLAQLRDALARVDSADGVARRAREVFATAPSDLPAVALRLPGTPDGADGLPPRPTTADAPGVHVASIDGAHVAWLTVGTRATLGEDTELVVRLSELLAPDDEYLGFLSLVTATLGQAFDRVAARASERALAAAQRETAAALQRSLLAAPHAGKGVEVAVHYRPAREAAQIGGDWYDSFHRPDGSVLLAIGDVAGHDVTAAAGMAQVRNLLRGLAFIGDRTPAGVLADLDRSLTGLGAELSATVLLGRIGLPRTNGATVPFAFANAGHPPPVLITADGARLLDDEPDPLLGLGIGDRRDRELELPVGATLVLYTDGLIERRGVPLNEGLDWVVRELDGRHGDTPEDLIDRLVGDLDDEVVEDDVAVMAVRIVPAA